MRDFLNSIASAAVGAIITVAVTAWMLTEGSAPAATARLNWITPSLTQSIEVSSILSGIADGTDDKDAKAAFATIAEKMRYQVGIVIYEVVISNNENKLLNRLSIQAEDPIVAVYRTDGSPNARTVVETFVGSNRIFVPELDPKTETRFTIVSGSNFRPENSIKVLVDNTLVPLEMDRFHSEINSEIARFINNNLWVVLVFLVGIVATVGMLMSFIFAFFPGQTMRWRLSMVADWELRQLDRFLAFAKAQKPMVFAVPTAQPPATTIPSATP